MLFFDLPPSLQSTDTGVRINFTLRFVVLTTVVCFFFALVWIWFQIWFQIWFIVFELSNNAKDQAVPSFYVHCPCHTYFDGKRKRFCSKAISVTQPDEPTVLLRLRHWILEGWLIASNAVEVEDCIFMWLVSHLQWITLSVWHWQWHYHFEIWIRKSKRNAAINHQAWRWLKEMERAMKP